jgi:hypothetical protein
VLADVLKRAFRPRPYQVVAAVAVFAAVVLLVRFTAINSEAYEFAQGFVAQDGRVASLTGKQRERSLLWFKGFSMSYGDKDGEASLIIRVTGERGEFNVPLALQKRQGRWSVVGAKVINGNGETTVVVE